MNQPITCTEESFSLNRLVLFFSFLEIIWACYVLILHVQMKMFSDTNTYHISKDNKMDTVDIMQTID